MPFVADRAMKLPPLVITESMQLRTLGNGIAYALCKSLHCSSCGHLFVDYRFNDQEMSRLYGDYRGEEYCSLRNHYEPGYVIQNAALSAGNSYRKSTEDFLAGFVSVDRLKILDWGGDTGRNTPFADQAQVVHIYEPSGVQPELSNALNVPETADFLSSYDLLVLSNVLEHVPYPASTLGKLANYMSTSSILYVEVPYEDWQCQAEADPQSSTRTQKIHWHEHINFFSKSSLAALLESCRLTVLNISAEYIDRGASGVSSSMALRVACAKCY